MRDDQYWEPNVLTVTGARCSHCDTADSLCRIGYKRSDLTCCARCDHEADPR